MRKLLSILGLVFSCVLAQAAAVNWTNYVPNIQVATNANVANQLQLGTTFTDGHLWPNAPDGTTPWYLEHTVPHTGGNLFQLIDPIGGPYFAITWLWEIQGADLLLTGSAQIQGTVRANDVVVTNNVTIPPTSLTPANPQTLTFSGASKLWLVATGDVAFASASLAAGRELLVYVDNVQATNINVVLPTGWRYISGAVTNILAPAAIGMLRADSRAANDTNVISLWSSE